MMATNDRFPAAFYAVFSNPLSGREADLEHWYEEVHIPDSLDAGLFESVRRYRRRDGADARFLTLWGCSYPNTEAALANVRPVAEKLRERGRIEVVQEVVFQEFVFRQEVYLERSPSRPVARELTASLSLWAEPAGLPAFEERMEPVVAAQLSDSSGTGISGLAQYGHREERARAIVLAERDQGLEEGVGTDAVESGLCQGLPPFGDAVPIFPGGSPAPSPERMPAESSSDATLSVWQSNWECISSRSV